MLWIPILPALKDQNYYFLKKNIYGDYTYFIIYLYNKLDYKIWKQ